MPVTWTRIRDYDDVRYEHSGTGIARVTIDRQRVRNAFRPQTVTEMLDAFRLVRDDPTIGVALLTGAGDIAFCSGGDQSYKVRGGYEDAEGVARLNVLDLQRLIRSLPIPVIALVNGYAIGGGHVLHVICDLSIASDNAIFGQTGPRVGSFDAGYGATMLARIVGHKKAREIWYLCRQYDAAQALEMGLVNAVVPLAELEAEGIRWADKILEKSPTAIRFLKRAFNADVDGLAGLQELAGDATMLYYTTDEAHEGSRAFLEKRKPDFSRFPAASLTDPSMTATLPTSKARVWLLASRPQTLPAAVGPVLVGLGVGLAQGPLNVLAAVCCLAVALLLQVAANLSNDLFDHRSGADSTDRVGPTRAAASGLLSERELVMGTGIILGLAAACGLVLVAIGGPVLLVLGVLAVVAAVAYTGGPFPYGYRGLGEVAVFCFFGVVAVAGTAYLQTGTWSVIGFAASVPVGALVTAILVVNNLRDIDADTRAGKRTLAVMFGRRFAQREYLGLLLVAYAVPVLLVATAADRYSALLPLLCLPLAIPLLRVVFSDGDPRWLNPVLKGTARLQLAFSALFALGLALHRVVGPA